jgi:uncharacterized membrane protein YdfJ with MMPL/SSD domain
MMIAEYSIAGRLIAMVVGVVLLVIVAGFALSQCSSRKTAEKKAEVAEGQAGAAIDAGAEAVNTAAEIVASDAATDAQVAAAQAEIRAAATGQKGKSAKRAACRFKAYANTPQCREPKP